jgi:ActR/RegA family two-component response regulator
MSPIAIPVPGPPSGAGQMGISPLPADEPLTGPLLLVEGSRGRRAALQHVLTQRGFRVTCAADTTSAASAMADIDFGYAVIGLPLRDDGGLAFIRRLRERCPTLRIVVVTDADTFASVIRAMGAGADDYLPQSRR